MKKIIKVLVKEILPIIVGILIALWINNWNENRKDKNYIKEISSSIDKELIETNKEISDNIENQKSLIDSLDYYKDNDKISIIDLVIKNNGISVPTVKINSWRAISNSKINLMEYDEISILANIEEGKEMLKVKSQNMINFIYPNTKETGTDKKELLKIMILDIINTEVRIQKDIERFINE